MEAIRQAGGSGKAKLRSAVTAVPKDEQVRLNFHKFIDRTET